jgi:MFS family permease
MSTTASPTLTAARRRRLPGDRRFRLLLAGLATSSAGDWLYNVALLAFVAERGGAGWLGVVTGARVLPIVLLGPVGGVLADRCDRRMLMLGADAVRAALMLGLAGVAVAGLPLWLAPLLAALATAAASAQPACISATTPRLVAPGELAAANAARAAVGQAAIVVGPALGALVLVVASPVWAFVANAGTFAASAAATWAIPAGPAFAPVAREQGDAGFDLLGDIRSGARALRGAPDAVRLVAADVACSAVYGAETVLLILVAHRLGDGDAGYGLLLGAFGLGGLAGAMLAGRFERHWRRALGVALVAVAVPLPLMGLTTSTALALALAVVGGAGAVVAEVLSETGLQRTLPADVLGRAFGLVIPGSLAGIVVGALLAGPLVNLLGLTGALTTVGGALLVVLAVILTPSPARAGKPAGIATAELA